MEVIYGGCRNGERPLDSGSMAPAMRGVFELRDEDKDTWYRLLYVKLGGVVYVLHCFTKKTNQTLPVYFCGHNSVGFQLLGMIHPQ